MIAGKIYFFSFLLIVCIIIPAIFTNPIVLFVSIMVWSIALVFLVIQILKDKNSNLENEKDQMILP
jgi:hypothetical protein